MAVPVIPVVVGVLVGAGAAVIAPLAWRHARPVVKSAVKAAWATADEVQVRATQLAEHAEDLVAEVRAEFHEATHAARTDAQSASTDTAAQAGATTGAGTGVKVPPDIEATARARRPTARKRPAGRRKARQRTGSSERAADEATGR